MASYILKKRPYLGKVKRRARIVQTFGAWQEVKRFDTLRAAGLARQKIKEHCDKQIFYRCKALTDNTIYEAIRSQA